MQLRAMYILYYQHEVGDGTTYKARKTISNARARSPQNAKTFDL